MREHRLTKEWVRHMFDNVPVDPPCPGEVWDLEVIGRLKIRQELREHDIDPDGIIRSFRDYDTEEFVYQQD